MPDVLEKCFAAGATNFRVMEMLSNAHTSTFGHPVPTPVSLNSVPGKAILVTGHDLHDLHMLLEQTQVRACTGISRLRRSRTLLPSCILNTCTACAHCWS